MVQYQKGPVCGVDNCRETRYYEDSGLLFCRRNGHQRHGLVLTQQDEDDFGPQGQKTRRKKDVQEKASRIYTGTKAIELFLQCYQLILRKQCWTLIHTHHLPVELEVVVKDLWELRLQLLKDRLQTTVDTEEVFSSQPPTDTEDEAKDHDAGKKWELRGRQIPSLLETLSICYLGTTILRLPISLGDFHRWATREEIPFIRAIREVPNVMKNKLPAHYIAALDTQSLLHADNLRQSVIHLCLLFNYSFELVLPPLNHPLFLFRYIRDLALPLEMYRVTSRITELLSIAYSFPTLGGRQAASSFPEVQLMALLVIAVKLHHPFDHVKRYATALIEPGIMAVDWDLWCKQQKDFDDRLTSGGKLGRGNEMKVQDRDILDMTGAQMDEYLDWFERTWVPGGDQEAKKGGLPTQLLDMFPTGRLDGSSAPVVDLKGLIDADQEALDAKLKAAQGSLKTRGIVSEERAGKSKVPVRRLGSFYKRYRKEEDLPPTAKVFYEAAANLIAVSLHTLLVAVLQTEQKLLKYRKKQLKEADVGDSEDENSDQPQENHKNKGMEDARTMSAGQGEDGEEQVTGFPGLTHEDIERLGSLDIDNSDSETSRMRTDSD